MARSTCSCLMILGNVEPTIRLCMDSVLSSGCFDEYILVLDNRIKDQTRGILAGYRDQYPGIRLLRHTWRNQDYAAARNAGLQQAKMERIYWQDGDEVLLDPDGVYSLLQDPAPIGYHIWQLSPTPYGADTQVHQLRLFPNLTGVKWELPVHEQVTFSLRRLGIPERVTQCRVWHYGYADDSVNAEKHIERAKIMRDWLKKHPRNDQGRAYLLEQYESSMAYLRNLNIERGAAL